MLVKDRFARADLDYPRILVRAESSQGRSFDARNVSGPLAVIPSVSKIKSIGHFRLHLCLPFQSKLGKEFAGIGRDHNIVVDRNGRDVNGEMLAFVETRGEFQGSILVLFSVWIRF